MKLSILIPSVFERDHEALIKKLLGQIGTLPVELLVLQENWRRHLGAKRQALLNMAQGDFVVHLDDDDDVADNYVAALLAAAIEHPHVDVIVFNQSCVLHAPDMPTNPFIVRTGMEYTVAEPAHVVDGKWADITRPPWHWCCWRTDFARQARFPPQKCDSDDWFWVEQLLPLLRTQHRIDQVLYHYTYHYQKSLAGVYTETQV